MWCWWRGLSPRSNWRPSSKTFRGRFRPIATSPTLKARESMTLWRHLGRSLSTNWECWERSSSKRSSSCVRTTAANSRMLRIDWIDSRKPLARRSTTASPRLMRRLQTPRRLSPDYKVSLTLRCRRESNEKRTSCRRWTTPNTTYRRRSMPRELTSHWNWEPSRTTATSD
jgi:hypothetical protein